MPHVVVAAGGTGGHMVPAHAVAQALLARGHRVTLMADARGLRFPGLFAGVEKRQVEAAVFGGANPLGWLRAGMAALRGRREAKRFLWTEGVAAVAGFGGYPVVPPVTAAHALRIPTLLHEQNAVFGRANRLLSGRATKVALSYADTARVPASADAVVTGNPVRAEVLAGREQPFVAPQPHDPFRLLVTGGSQGASILSRVVPEAVLALPQPLRARLRLQQQCRPEDLSGVSERYRAAGIDAECVTYMEDLPARIAAAHLVVARSGASTMAELAAIGRPAILIPFAAATDDHQTANARPFVSAGAGVTFQEVELNAARLAGTIAGFAADPAGLAAAAAAARALGAPDAAERIADLLERLMDKQP